jgi:hypothetical protein
MWFDLFIKYDALSADYLLYLSNMINYACKF